MVTTRRTPVTVHRAISVPEFQAYTEPPKLIAMVKQADPARKTMVMIQSIILHFSLKDLPGWASMLGNRRR